MATQLSKSSKKTQLTAIAGELQVILQRAEAFTNASGVALAISEGKEDEIICRARSGATAPEIGATLRTEGTFTGLCMQSKKTLRCEDTETDLRVDAASMRALGIRSLVVVPIKEGNKVTGVLTAFAPTPCAFTVTHSAVLATFASQIADVLAREERYKDLVICKRLGLSAEELTIATSPRGPSARFEGTSSSQSPGRLDDLNELLELMDDYVSAYKQQEWLNTPHEAFQGRKPIDLIREGGARKLIAEFIRLRDGQSL